MGHTHRSGRINRSTFAIFIAAIAALTLTLAGCGSNTAKSSGDPNTLTLDIGTSSLAQATSANTCLVQIEKFVGTAPAVTSFGGPIEVDPEGREVKA